MYREKVKLTLPLVGSDASEREILGSWTTLMVMRGSLGLKPVRMIIIRKMKQLVAMICEHLIIYEGFPCWVFLHWHGVKSHEKKIEQEKLEKLARKGYKPEEQPTATGATPTDVKTVGTTSSTTGVSTDKYRNYAVLAGFITALSALGWYLKANAKKPEVHD